MPRKKADHLYIISCGNDDNKIYKIGVTSNIENRIKSLQTGNPQLITLEWIDERLKPTLAEKYLHRVFQKYRQEGEWFKGISVRQIRAELMMCHSQP